jgi:hypothetical protein
MKEKFNEEKDGRLCEIHSPILRAKCKAVL